MENEYLKIAKQAKKFKAVENLMSKVTIESLKHQHKLQITKKASGVDGVNKVMYEKDLDNNLMSLVSRMKNFSYKPQPVKRAYIFKVGSDDKRALGIPAYEDKLVRGAMAHILNAIYETKFKDFSYGFRPNKDCHKAINFLNKIIMTRKTGFVVDADIAGFFDNLSQDWIIKFLEHDIKDKNFIRYIKRFLKSGIMDKGKYLESDKGTPQGGLISPILANVYLHYVLDLWFEKEVTEKFKGESFMVRYADDFICCFRYENEAIKFYNMLKDRLGKFGLNLAKNKSKVIRFGRYARENGSNATFDFLGFTFINATNRQGKYIVLHHTSQKKLSAKMIVVKEWLRQNMHLDKCELVKKLNIKLKGHYRYYGMTGNGSKLELFQRYVEYQLFKALNRRGQRKMTWDTFAKFKKYNPIARPKIYHSLLNS